MGIATHTRSWRARAWTGGTTTQLGPLRQPRVSHVMVELLDGRVLLVGGEPPDTDLVPGPLTWVEVYDLEAGSSAPIEDGPLTDGWGALYPYTQLGGGRVVLAGLSAFTEPCPNIPRPTSDRPIGGYSKRVVDRLQTIVFDPATDTLGLGPLVPPPAYTFVSIGGDRALISREERAFASCAADAASARYPWLGLAAFGSGTFLGSPNPITGEGALDVEPPIVYSSGVLLPDGRVALMDDSSGAPGPRRIDVLTIDP